MNTPKYTAIVTGANRGIGFEVAKQLLYLGYKVVVSSRSKVASRNAVEELQKFQKNRAFSMIDLEIDVSSEESIDRAKEFLKDEPVGILVNNAGVFLDDPREVGNSNVFSLPTSVLKSTLEVNLFGALQMIKAFVPLMEKIDFGRVVNVASGMGRDVELNHDAPYYRLSKSALINLTKIVSLSVQSQNIKINSVCPGWVRTRMGGAKAIRDIEVGARGVVAAATLSNNGPSGKLLRDGLVFNWQEPCEALNKQKD